ncbi:MAG: FG-GAP repeat protein [Thermoleophilia bacterium]|nr:FG-GAP repeat protein [Thermoleophilia bacterium]
MRALMRRLCRLAVPIALLLAVTGTAAAGVTPAPQLRASVTGADGTATWDATDAAVAHDTRRDRYLVVWAASSSDPDEIEIFGRVADRLGRWTGPATRLSQMGPEGNAAFDADTPDVAYNAATDRYLVVWSGDDAHDGEFDVYAQQVDPNGGEVGGDIRLSTAGAPGDLTRRADAPAVVHNAVANEFLVVWSADDTGADDEFEVYAQRVSANGAELGTDDMRISDMGPDGNAAYDAVAPDVAVSAAGGYSVVWEGDDDTAPLADDEREIFLQRLTATGAETGTNDVRISDMGTNGSTLYAARTPAIAYNDASGEFFAVWSGDDNILGLANDEREIFGQRLSTAGGQLGTNDQRISDMGPDRSTAFGASDPDLAYSPAANEFLVTWRGDDDTGGLVDDEQEVFAQRLGPGAAEIGTNDMRVSRMGGTGTPATGREALAPAVAAATSTRRWMIAWHGDDDSGSLADGEYEVYTSLVGWEPSIDLGTAGNLRIRIDGAAAGAETGSTVTDAGDVNGDGIGDVLVGAPSATAGGVNRAYVVWGTAGSANVTVDLAGLGTAGFAITGLGTGQRTGLAVTGVGDLDGDGRADIAVGTDDDRNGRTDSGSVHVIFGKTTSTAVDLTALGAGGFRIDGPEAGALASRALAAGDVNGDGRADLVIGAPGTDDASGADAGAVYVVYGTAGAADIDLAALSPAHGWRITGPVAGVRAGVSVAAGDIDGDGDADVVLGTGLADNNGRTDSGSAWVVFGGPSGGDVDLADLGSRGFRIDGAAAGDGAGPVAVAGDMNDDNRAEVVVGAPGADPSRRSGAGTVAVVFGTDGTTTHDLGALGSGGFLVAGAAAGDGLGTTVAASRDVDGDRRGEVIAGAPGADPSDRVDAGSEYVIFGQATTDDIDAGGLGARGLRLDGAAAGDALGGRGGTIADVTGDGRPEVLAGAPFADPAARTSAGRAYAVSPALLMPGAATAPATGVLPAGATLNGVVSPRGQVTRYWFEYGTTAAYGTATTPASAGSGTSQVPVSAPVSGLPGDTLHHFRLVTENADGLRAHGADTTVTTDATPPTTPTANGGSLSWTSAASVTITGSGATDALTGIARYEYRTSTGGGAWSGAVTGSSVAVSTAGETVVQFRATDGAGNQSAWGPPVGTAAGTVRIDRTAPSLPTVTGGSTSWQSVASVTVSASGSTDAQAGLAGYEYRTVANATVVPGAAATVTSEGETILRFRAVDAAGNASAWTSATADGPNTVRIDRTGPTVPGATGGGDAWQNIASLAISRTAATDAGAGVASYQSRTSTDGGANWTAPVTGVTVTVTAQGETLVQFRAIDGVGNISDWGPSHTPGPTTAGTARIGTQFGVDLANTFNVHLRIDGAVAGDRIGLGALAPAGDVNGDGIQDVLIGARSADPVSRTDAGAAYVVFGRATPGVVDLANLGTGGYAIRGAAAGDAAGTAVASAGDVNGDGLADALIGAPGADPLSRSNAGAVHVVFGSAGTGTIDLAAPGSRGYLIAGAAAGDAAGTAVASAGDLDGDERPDVAVGAPGADPSSRADAGAVAVAHGQAGTATIDLGTAPGPRVSGAAAGDHTGTALAGVADMNADGRPDLVIGSPDAGPVSRAGAGTAFVLFTPPTGTVDLASPGTSGFAAHGAAAGDRLGAAVASAGDVNDDDLPDVVVGAPAADPFNRYDAGAAYVLYGGAATATRDAASLAGTGYRITGATAGGGLGGSVGPAGDANGDGRDDVLITAAGEGYQARSGAGATWRVHGLAAPADVDLRVLAAAGGTRIDGLTAGDGTAPASGLLDLDADGRPEVLAGAPGGDANNRTDSGSVRVVIPSDAPSVPVVSGGSLAWRSVASTAIGARSSTPTAAAAPVGYQYRTSRDGGATWGAPATGATATITDEQETLVQFRAVDAAGRTSSWVPDHPSGQPAAAGTVRQDRTLPTVPSVSGGSAAWFASPASRSVTATGSTDTGGSGFSGYQYQTSTNGGTSWAQASGSGVSIAAVGETLVQFRSVDGAGNVSAWAPTHPSGDPVPAAVVRITGAASGDLLSPANIRLTIEGAAAQDGQGGLRVFPAGDVNGDRIDDIVVAAPAADPSGRDGAGTVHVVFGRTDLATVDLASPGSAALRIDGADRGDALGTGVAAIGDVDDDGRADLLLGAPGTDPSGRNDAGSAYLVLGPERADPIDLATPGAAAVRVDGAAAGDALGTTAAAPGDLDRDGRADMVLGAPGADRNGRADSGSAYVVHTPAPGKDLDLAAFSGAGYVIDGTDAGDHLGTSVAGGGDVNDDGLPDVVVGAPGADTLKRADAGAAYVVFGAATPSDVDTLSLGARGRMLAGGTAGDALGTRVAIAGDQNNDRRADIAATAPGADANGRAGSGSAVVLWGATSTGTADMAALGTAGYRIDGATAGDALGEGQLSATPDIDGDGRPELAVGSRTIGMRGRSASGAAYWVFGAATTTSVDLRTHGGRALRLDGAADGDGLGGGVTAVPDLTGDGRPELVAAAPGADPRSRTDAGGVSIVSPTVLMASAETLPVLVAENGSAQLRAVVNPRGTATTWRFEHGATTGTPVSAGSGTADATVTTTAGLFLPTGSTYNTRVIVTNAAGYSTYGVNHTFVPRDVIPPTVPTANGGSISWVDRPSATITGGGSTDTGNSGLAGYDHRISTDGGNTWSTPTAGAAVTITAEGEALVQFRARDVDGNLSAWGPATPTPDSTVRLDRTSPTAPAVTGGSTAWQSAASVTVTGAGGTDAASGVAGYEYRTSTDGGATWTLEAPGSGIGITLEGETLVQFRTVDGVGRPSAWTPASPTAGSQVRLDRTAPAAPTVTGGSGAPQSVPSIAISATATDDLSGLAGYEHRTSTDGGATWSTPAPGASLTVTAEGTTDVQFRATDTAGNVGAWGPGTGGTGRARIDRTPPAAPANLTGPSPAVTPTLTWHAVGDAAGYVVVRDGTEVGAPSGATWADTGLTGEGTHTYRVLAVDAAGNRSDPSGPHDIERDTTPAADPVIAAGSEGSLTWRNVASVTIAVDAVPGAVVQHRTSTDGGASWSAPAAGASVAVTAEGETLVQFRSVDPAGNAGAWVPSHTGAPAAAGTARIDRTPPPAPTGLAGASPTAAPALTWTAVPGATGYVVTRDGVAVGGPAGTTFTDSPVPGEGIHQYRVAAVDAAGNRGVDSAPVAITVDVTPPPPPGGPAAGSEGSLAWRNVPSVTIAVDPTAGATTEHRTSTDGGATWSTPATGPSVVVTAEGETLVQFRTVDDAGNRSVWTPAIAGGPVADGTARIDRTSPAAPTGLAGASPTNAPAITWTAVPGATAYAVTRDGVEIGTVPSGTSFTDAPPPAEATYAYRVITIDAAGNRSAPSAAHAVTVDLTAPAVPVVPGAGSDASLTWRNAAAAVVTADPVPATTTEHRTSTDGGATWSAPAAGASVTVTAEGETLVQFRAVDTAGNASGWGPAHAAGPDATATVRLDRTPPPAPTVSGGSLDPTSVASVPVTATLAPGTTARYRTSTDGGATWSTPAPGTTVTVTAEGETLVQFQATDEAGNTGAWGPSHTPAAAGATVRIDRSAPPAPVITATADVTVPRSSGAGRVDLLTTVSGDAQAVAVTQSGRVVVDGPPGAHTDAGLADDTTYAYEAVARDAAGNLSPVVSVEVTTPDRTAPAQPAPPTGSGYPVELTWPAMPGVDAYEASRDGASAGTGPGTSRTDAAAVDTAAPPAPAGVTVTPTGPGRAAIAWDAVTDQGTTYEFAVRASDAEGNTSAFSPAAQIVARSGVGRYRVLVDGVQVTETTTPGVDLEGLTPNTPLAVTIVVLDRAGNASPSSAPVSLTVPATPGTPRLLLTADPAYVRPGDPVRFQAVVDGPSGGEVTWDLGDGSAAAGAAAQTRYPAAGRRLVEATVTAPDGTQVRAAIQVVVDDVPPTVEITQAGAVAQVGANDDASGLERLEWLPGAGQPARAVPGDGIPLAEGPNTVTVRATDRAGNVREVTRTLVADRTAPTLSVRIPALAIGKSGAAVLTAADTGSGLAAIEYAGKRFPARTAKLVLPAGRRVTVAAIDNAGNRREATFTIRRVANAKRGTRLVRAPGEPKLKGDQKVLYTTTWAQLQVLGRLPKSAKPNGRYTKRMAAAVTKYQKKVKLKGTGIVEPKTRARLAKDVAKKALVITGR